MKSPTVGANDLLLAMAVSSSTDVLLVIFLVSSTLNRVEGPKLVK